MGDASQVRLAIAEESTFGVAEPDTNYSFLRFSNENLRHAQETNESDEIDPTRQPPGFLRVSRSSAGGFTSEDSLIAPAILAGATQNGFDLPIRGAMMGAWGTIVDLSALSIDLDVPGASEQFDVTATVGTPFTDVVAGQWIRLTGFDLAGNSGEVYAHVITKASNAVLECEGVHVAADGTVTPPVNEAGQSDIAVKGSMIRIGTTRVSFTIEKQFMDVALPGGSIVPVYSLGTGLVVGTWDWGVTAQQTVRQTFGFLGRRLATTTSSQTPTAPQAKWATPRLTAPFDVAVKLEGAFGAQSVNRIAEINFRLDNRPRTDFEVGSDSPQVGIGTPSLTGNYNVFMDAETLQAKLEANTLSKLAFLLRDGTNGRFTTFPAIRYTDGGADAAGREQAVTQQLAFAAEPDASGVAFQIDRF